jgi:hypothetical protein
MNDKDELNQNVMFLLGSEQYWFSNEGKAYKKDQIPF